MGECGGETKASFGGREKKKKTPTNLNTTVPARVHKRRGVVSQSEIVGRWVSPTKLAISCPCTHSPFVCLFVFVFFFLLFLPLAKA